MERSSYRWGVMALSLCGLVFVWSCSTEEVAALDPGSATLAVGTVTGTITASGAPLEGARVFTVPPTVEATTDALGRYTLPGLLAQTLGLVVEASGFVRATATVSIIAGRTVVKDLSLTSDSALGRLRGVITDGEIPLERVGVATSPSSFSVVTAGDGLYDFTGVAPGVYRIDAFRVGFHPGVLRLTVLPGATTTGDLCLGRRSDAIIAGTVRDAAGTPVNNALVEVFRDTEAWWTTTGADGAFQFTGLVTGFYVIGVTATGYYPGSRSLEAWGGVPVNGDVVLSLTSTLPPLPGAVAGTVWDEDYVPLPGATVSLDPASATPRTTTVDALGRYVFASVPTGTHTVEASDPDHLTGTLSVAVGTSITANASFALKRSL